MSGWMARTTAVLTLLLGATSQAHAQATGTISGTVVDARTGEGIVGAQVHIPDTSLGVITAANGEFILSNVPVGEQTVRMQSLGYEATEQTVTVVDRKSVV